MTEEVNRKDRKRKTKGFWFLFWRKWRIMKKLHDLIFVFAVLDNRTKKSLKYEDQILQNDPKTS